VLNAREAGLLLWTCLALFAARVIGQLQAVLVSPDWLPGMDAWFSGLLPYHLLLPAQIAILMLMTVIAWNPRVRGGGFALSHPRAAGALRLFALLYFVVMAVRLAVNINTNRADFWSEGAIPVAFHWVLALFILVAGRSASARIPAEQQQVDSEADDIPYGDVPALTQPLAGGSGFGKQV
jgi:uncharacterized membrane protein YozB (DUF420 family)